MIDPDLELIISLKPDLIIITVEGNSKNTYKSLIDLGFRVFATNPRDFEGVTKMISDLGALTNKNKEAVDLISKMKKQKENLLLKTINQINDSCFILISLVPLMTLNENTFINEVISLSGFRNLYSKEPSSYPEISWEDLISKNPEYIIIPVNLQDSTKNINTRDAIKERLKYNSKNHKNKFIFIDENLFFRPGPRMLDAAEELYLKKL